MRINWMLTAAVVAMSVAAGARAQSAKSMETYTGCVESMNHGAAFLLTQVDSKGSMQDDMAMKPHDDMAMKHDEKMDTMSPKSFALAGSTDLNKHVGQRVSVTGSLKDGSMGTMREDLSTLTIKSLKVIAKSCS